jgi:hypothetical protein
VLSREKDGKEQILVHARNQTPPALPLSIRVTGPPEQRWTHTSAQESLIRNVEADLEEKIFIYKLGVRGKLHLEWSWQVEPGRGGMECTILAHIRTGSSAISVQNKRHLHWKETGTITIMSDDTGGALAAHNLLLKRDHQSTEHLAHKQKMASILASPQNARKKRFTKLDLGNLGTNPPAGANPFQVLKGAGDTLQFSPVPGPGYRGVEELGPPPLTPATLPSWTSPEGTPLITPELDQNFCKGSIGQKAALRLETHV